MLERININQTIGWYDEIRKIRDFLSSMLNADKNVDNIRTIFLEYCSYDWKFITDHRDIEKIFLFLLSGEYSEQTVLDTLDELNKVLDLFDEEKINENRMN